MPLLSILLPYLHADDALMEAIQSICSQTFADWELILIGNGDETEQQQLMQTVTDSRCIHLYEKEKGIASALNAGLKKASGKYIGRMDADDICLPQRFERQITHLEKYPKIAALSCQTQFESSLQAAGYKSYVDWQNQILSPEEHRKYRFQESPLAHPSVCFRKELVVTYGGYSTRPEPEDYELWLRWMDAGENLEKLPFTGVIWKDSPDRLSRRHSNYSEEAFFRLKARYLKRWTETKKIILCGSSTQAVQRWRWMEDEGLQMESWTDIHPKAGFESNFIVPDEIRQDGQHVVLSLIAQPGTREKVEAYFIAKGYQPGVDYFSCA